jgi:CHAD domain-containing protein
VTRALGPVREADVALGHLAEHLADRPDEGPQGVPVRRWLEALRTSRRDAMLAAIDEEAIGRLWRRADALRAIAAASDTAAREWRDVLAGRVRARGSALAREVETAGVMYAADALHAVRIATKKLRYAIEVAGELRLVPSAAVLRTLKRQQDLLGRIHDLEVLAGLADRASADAAGRLNVGRLVGEWHRECRELHARYLRARAATTRVTALACDEMYKRIGGAADSARPAHRRRRAARAA